MNKELPQGWFHEGDITLYRQLVDMIPDGGKIIELGVWKGRSLCSVADIIKRKNLIVYAVDTFKGSTNEAKEHEEAGKIDLEALFRSYIAEFGIEAKIYSMTTDEAASIINEKFDLIFIDADHSFNAITSDLKNWIPKCKGIIAGHDYELKSIKDAVDKVFKDVKYTHCAVDIGRSTMWYHNFNEQKHSGM